MMKHGINRVWITHWMGEGQELLDKLPDDLAAFGVSTVNSFVAKGEEPFEETFSSEIDLVLLVAGMGYPQHVYVDPIIEMATRQGKGYWSCSSIGTPHRVGAWDFFLSLILSRGTNPVMMMTTCMAYANCKPTSFEPLAFMTFICCRQTDGESVVGHSYWNSRSTSRRGICFSTTIASRSASRSEEGWVSCIRQPVPPNQALHLTRRAHRLFPTCSTRRRAGELGRSGATRCRRCSCAAIRGAD